MTTVSVIGLFCEICGETKETQLEVFNAQGLSVYVRICLECFEHLRTSVVLQLIERVDVEKRRRAEVAYHVKLKDAETGETKREVS